MPPQPTPTPHAMLPDLPDHVLLDGALGGRDLATIEAVSCRFRLKSAELEDGSSGGAAGAGAPGGVAGGEAGGGEVEAGSRGHDRIPPNGILLGGRYAGCPKPQTSQFCIVMRYFEIRYLLYHQFTM